jgi:hypothetical protein
MKDFDFDELDRAVNSVLATKDTKTDETDSPAPAGTAGQAVQVTDQTDDSVPVTVQTHVEEPASHDNDQVQDASHEHAEGDSHDEVPEAVEDAPTDSHADEPEPQDDHHSDEQADEPSEKTETVEADDAHTAALAAIPVKRGRFMDMVAPGTGSNDTKKPLPVRGGVTLTPSSDFVATTTAPDSEDATQLDQEPSQVDVATPLVESEVEPEVTPAAFNESSEADAGSSEDAVDTKEDETSISEPTTDNPDQPAVVSADTPVASAPFIPDVPVEKRPLNSLSGDAPESADAPKPDEDTDTSEHTSETDPTLSANAPKEFGKDIMAVEANETVGEHDETQTATDSAKDASDTEITATSAEPHPMFDTSTLAHSGAVATHHTSKMSWAVVGVSLFIVGAALGVLYFLYGQG